MASSINKIVVSNEAELRNALLAASATSSIPYTLISIEAPQPLLISSPLILPNKLASNNLNYVNKLIIEGNGITLIENYNTTPAPENQFILGRAFSPSNISEYGLVIRNVNFYQKSPKYPSLQLIQHNNSIVENCKFTNGTMGMYAAFCSNLEVKDSNFTNYTTFGVVASYGNYITWNAIPDKNIYACKNVSVTNCSFTSGSTTSSSISFEAVQSPIAKQCIFNGSANNHIIFKSQGGSTTGVNLINNIVIEDITIWSFANTAAINLSLAEGYAEVGHITYIPDGGVLIKGESVRGNPVIYVNGLPKWNIGVKFETSNGVTSGCAPVAGGSVIWDFKNLDIDRASEIFDSTNWVNGAIPFYRYAEFYKIPDGKKILTNYLSVNGKVIS